MRWTVPWAEPSSLRRRVLGIFVAILLMTAVPVAALRIVLARGPIPLPWLDRRIERALGEIVPSLSATVEHTELAWERFAPDVRVLGLRVSKRSGPLVASVPLVSIRPSLLALLRGKLAVSQAGLAGVKLALLRTEGGELTLPDSGASGDGGLLALLTQGAPAGDSYLRRIYLRDASLSLDDRKTGTRWEMTEVDLDLRRRGARASVVGGARVRLRAGTVFDLRTLSLHLASNVSATLGDDGIAEASGSLLATEGEMAFDDGPQPLPVRRLAANVAFVAPKQSLEVSAVHAEIGRGTADGGLKILFAPADRRVEAQGQLRGVSTTELVRLWPPSLAHATREWIATNIRVGSVPQGRFSLAFALEPTPGGPTIPQGAGHPTAVDVAFAFDDLAVHYLADLPDAKALRGSATLDTRGFTAKVASGQVGTMKVSGGSVAIDYHAHPVMLAIAADAEGPSGDLFAVLDQPPLRLPAKIGLTPGALTGTTKGHVELRLPIVGDLEASQLKVAARAAIQDATQPAVLRGIGVQGANLAVRFEESGTIDLEGTTSFTGLPAAAAPANVKLHYAPGTSGSQLDASVDGPDSVGQGTATFVDGALGTLQVARLRLGRSDLKIGIVRDDAGVLHTSLDGERFDLEGLARGLRNPDGSMPKAGGPYVLDFRFAHVNAAPGLDLADVNGAIRSDGTHLQQAAATGRTEQGGTVSLDLVPGANGGTLRAHADHGGEMLHALGYVDGVSGGRLVISAAVGDEGSDRKVRGDLEFTNFRVNHVPLLGRILSLGSFEGLAGLLGNEGLPFRRLHAPFVWTDSTIEVHDARAVGAIGLTAGGTIDRSRQTIELDGDLIPVESLNTALGKVPLVGGLITGKGSEVFGIAYKVRGPLKSPDVSVNALSALAPGALRKMFSAMFSD